MLVLLIEPDVVLAKIYRRALERDGWRVVWAAGAQRAIDAADAETPDVIVLELQLVEHSGIEFLYELRSYPAWQGIPVVVHTFVPPTAFPDKTILEQELGVRSYQYKPNTNIAQLTSSLREWASIEQ